MEFYDLSEARKQPSKVTALRCREWPGDLSKFPELRRLDLSGTSLQRLDPSIQKATQLEALDLGDTNLEELPPEFFRLTQLRELDLRFNPGSRFRLQDFSALTQLQVLRLPYSAQPQGLAELCRACSRLQILDLSGMSLTELPPEIGQLRELRILDLARGDLSALPTEFWQLDKLEELNLESARLTQLPPQLGQLQSLRSLNLLKVPLTGLPAEIARLPQLEKMDLASSDLIELPQLPSTLRELRIWYAPLTGLPEGLSELRRLDLYSCRLKGQLPDLGQNLVEVDLRETGLTNLPDLSSHRQLQQLQLDGNPITQLPAWIGQLTALEVLSLKQCSLTAVPPELGQLKRLRCLYLQGNPLADLPAELEQLSNLEVLSLAETACQKLPTCVNSMPALRSLRLTGLQFSAAEVQRIKKNWPSADLPRVKKAQKTRKLSQKPLSKRVLAEIERLGGRLIKAQNPATDLPEALRQWRDEVRFPADRTYSGELGNLELEGIRLGHSPMGQEYEAFKNEAYFELGLTGHHCILLVRVHDKEPEDPQLGYLDHDDFWATEASLYRCRLSEFLAGLN